MTEKAKRTEAEVAAVVVATLESAGLDVYQEVTLPGGVADIVALNRTKSLTHVVEVKVGMSLAALIQARSRRSAANHVWLAVADRGHEHDELCRDLGLGMLGVRWDRNDEPKVTQHVKAPLLRAERCKLFDRCEPEHKTHAPAGSVGKGGRWTPFTKTCAALHAIVTSAGDEGMVLAEAVTRLDVIKGHHYQTRSSCLSAMTQWIRSNDVPGISFVSVLSPLRVRAVPIDERASYGLD